MKNWESAIENLVAHGLPRDFAEGMLVAVEQAIEAATTEARHGVLKLLIRKLGTPPFASMSGSQIAQQLQAAVTNLAPPPKEPS